MTASRVGVRLGLRTAVIGVALFAAVICGLGSAVMQELAHGQRDAYNLQVDAAKRYDARCAQLSVERKNACSNRNQLASASDDFKRETDQLGARARALQSPGGSINWAQSWLLTLLGIAAILVAITVTTAVDLEKRRLTAGWSPSRASFFPFLAAVGSSLTASVLVAFGAIGGSLIAMIVGRKLWPLDSESVSESVPSLGEVALIAPSFGGLVGFLAVVAALTLVAWFTARTIATLFIGISAFGVAALLAAGLPMWMPGVALPATTGMWAHHRGEIIHLWQWPTRPIEDGMESFDWSALSLKSPEEAAVIGAILLLLAAVALARVAIRQSLR